MLAAGLSLLAGPAAWLDQFDKVRLPYNINVLTQASADFALSHKAVFDGQTRLIRAERVRMKQENGQNWQSESGWTRGHGSPH